MNTTGNLRLDNAEIMFKDKETYVLMSFRGANTYAFGVTVDCWHLDWQVSSVAQISNALSQVFSAVEHLTLEHEVHSQSSEGHNVVDRIEWRNLLRSFSNVKILRVEDGLAEELSHCLRLEDGELPLELLPELQELTYFQSRDGGDTFSSFIDARRNAGRPVTLVRHYPNPSPGSSQVNAEARYLIRGDALQVYRLMRIFRHLLNKVHSDTHVPYATEVMPSGKAPGDISERSTIPNNVSFASSDGLAPTSTEITSRRSIQVSTPT
jgi:hypothetical protein